MLKIALYLIAFILFPLSSYSENRTNIAVIDSLVFDCSNRLFDDLLSKNIYNFSIDIPDHPASEYIKIGILSHPELKHFVVYGSKRPNTPNVVISIKEISISYDYIDENDAFYNREANLIISAYIESPNLPVLPPVEIKSNYNDKVDRTKLSEIEQNTYDFAKGKKPEEETDIFDEIFEPVIIIGATAIAVILFFTVRSG